MAIAGVAVGYYLWNKPHKKVENVTGINIDAVELYRQYEADESRADKNYLNAAIEVAGKVESIEKNQDGGAMIILNAGGPSQSIQCAMRDNNFKCGINDKITVKGFCSGNGITGVSLTDCVLLNH